jgi:murein DD-endopeptidase MepM/ murein hydrolase activator NlpD
MQHKGWRRVSHSAFRIPESPLGLAFRIPLLALLLSLGLWAGLNFAPVARAQDQVGTYTVAPGDTLSAIAEQFGVTVEALAQLNQIADPTLLQVGQVLLIPSTAANLGTLPTVRVQASPGDTLAAVAQRYTQDPGVLATVNNISPTTRLFPGQTVRLPSADAPPLPLRYGAVAQFSAPDQLPQGRTGQMWVRSRRPLTLTARWNGLPITLTAPLTDPTRLFGWLPVPALLDPGVYTLSLTYTANNGLPLTYHRLIPVVDGGYATQAIDLPPDRTALLDPTLLTSETQKVSIIWAQVRSAAWWAGPLMRPIAEQYGTTSPFGERRDYNAGTFFSYHAGQDFGAPAGVTVTVPADGIVALAEPLQVRGNAVIIDHGQGVFSGYWHLSQILVSVGQPVKAGDILGLVGNTGLSTGAHLHWELRIYGIAVDPMQFLTEPLIRGDFP